MFISSVSGALILAVTVTLLSTPAMPQHTSGTYNVTEIMESLLRGYDKNTRPNYGGPPVDVGVTMYVLGIQSVSEKSMEYTMDFYFRQHWRDSRLAFQSRLGLDSLTLHDDGAKNLWIPDTFFANERCAYLHTITTPNTFVKISSTGDVLRSVRLTVTAGCPMNLQYFPMDRQLCPLEIESYGYTMRDIRYSWRAGDKAVGISPDVQLPEFRVVGHRSKSIQLSLNTGNYSKLALEIYIERSMGHYLIQVYIPAMFIVAMSWVSFWLNRNPSPARVVLGVTTVLSMLTLICFTNADFPRVSYVKSIDVYLGTCFLMVFVALLQFATVGYVAKRIQINKNMLLSKVPELQKSPNPLKGQNNHSENAHGMELASGDPESGAEGCDRVYGVNPTLLDKYSRVVFPVTFVCFNALYWIIYTNIDNKDYNNFVPI